MSGGEGPIVAALEENPPDFTVIVFKDLREYGYRYFGLDYSQELHSWLLRRYRPLGIVARSPRTAGKRCGIAVLEPN